jgi:hypothetical protein
MPSHVGQDTERCAAGGEGESTRDSQEEEGEKYLKGTRNRKRRKEDEEKRKSCKKIIEELRKKFFSLYCSRSNLSKKQAWV